ncbi:Rv1733c family protein [Actinomadura scrupuli]|uniref:Rv1733c family protein n=1 Tax=Actinomadura scrupuli TaxID=559629 RepID=UPI003D95E166
MRRPVDRVQTAAALGLLIVFLALAPLVAGVTTGRAYDSGMRAERQERTAHRPVVATIVAGDGITDNSVRGIRPTVRLQWRAHDGTLRSALVPQRERDKAGSHRRIWIDRTGNLTRRPREHGQTVADAALAGTASVTMVALPCLLLYLMVRRRLDHHRFAEWTADWARTAPLWTRRPH